MRIALINEVSQADKNSLIFAALERVAGPLGHTVVNCGMYGAQDPAPYTYVHAGLLCALLLNAGAADYVVTGCGTGAGAMLACNSFPGVLCGHIEDALDAYTFSQINDGNAAALPFAKGFGWGGERQLEYIFTELFSHPGGGGYPPERAQAQKGIKTSLDLVRQKTLRGMPEILRTLDPALVRQTMDAQGARQHFWPHCRSEEIAAALREVLGEA